MNFNHPLILASKSPRRQQLLKDAGFKFEVVSIDVDESFPSEMDVELVAKYLAEKKAKDYQSFLKNEYLITADTVVIIDNLILNKPVDYDEAKSMLQKLSGRAHKVMTGVCVANKDSITSFDETTTVIFKTLTNQEIDHYIMAFQPFDKAGAYGIQEWIGMIGIEKIEGSYFNVVGLPIHALYKVLMENN
jgi:septum formation protein